MGDEQILSLIDKMTLEEKADFCSGRDFWHTQNVDRLGIPSIMVSDGPHGLRKQDMNEDSLGQNESLKSVCFPSGCLSASSFDRQVMLKLGETLGEECQKENIGILLGPSMNIKRSPLCGRNFEYYSEDPYLTSEIAAAYIKGVQSKHVGTCAKHFFANNQERYRVTMSSNMDERSMREIYLAAFEGAVKKSHPWSMMAACNQVNHVQSTENQEVLEDILRDEWGFDGFVMSDWGIIRNRVKSLQAGLDLEMPSSYGYGTEKIVEAVRRGELSESKLEDACFHIMKKVFEFTENRDGNIVVDAGRDHDIAREVAEESMILLKNDGTLPLKKESKILVIGSFAKVPRYQGAGSSHINSKKVSSFMDAAKQEDMIYLEGFDESSIERNEQLLQAAIAGAEAVDTVLVFAGLSESDESEGFDRQHMKLPECQNKLIYEISKCHANVVVILHNGAPVEMPWIDDVNAVLECYLGGEAVGEAQYRILYGEVNPSGKLAETFPIRLQDNPTYPFYTMEGQEVNYREGNLVGYRYYDAKEMPVLFPFGHGLSYTTFDYDQIQVSAVESTEQDVVEVKVLVSNTGNCYGKEVIQLYICKMNPVMIRPIQELRRFEKIGLQAGESKEISFCLNERDFSYWNERTHDWFVEDGIYQIRVGSSSRDIRLKQDIQMISKTKEPYFFTIDSTVEDVMTKCKNRKAVQEMADAMGIGFVIGHEEEYEGTLLLMRDVALRMMLGYMGYDDKRMKCLLEQMNQS